MPVYVLHRIGVACLRGATKEVLSPIQTKTNRLPALPKQTAGHQVTNQPLALSELHFSRPCYR